jgi:plastocyanin
MRRIAVLLAAMAAFTVAACGGDDKPAASGASSSSSDSSTASSSKSSGAYGGGSNSSASSGGGATLKIAADPSGAKKFTKSDLTAKAGEVTIQFSNQAQIPHAVEIEGNGLEETSTKVVTGADAPPLKLKLKPGTYTFYCPVGDHRADGMEGKLVVR